MKLYESIEDMPVYNWFKCVENKDYKYCLVDIKKYKDAYLLKCTECFSKLYAEYIDTFGISKQLEDILNIQNQIAVYKINIALGKKSDKTFLSIKETELKEKLEAKQVKTNTTKVIIEKYLGFRLNEKEVTVKDYYNYLEVIKENGRTTD